ncbi:MAG: GNAT family N-acetyltransferase [Bacteroidota bacterium]
MVEIQVVSFGNPPFELIRKIRVEVFVDEQHVPPDLEFDEFEETSTHFLAYWKGIPVGTARWRKVQEEKWGKLERFAVLAQYRSKGVGKELVKKVLEDMPLSMSAYLNAQRSAEHFYQKLGFKAVGEEFMEANIPHIKMTIER